MLIIPAVDIMGGRVVRLEKGDFKKVKKYPLSPLKYAKRWESQGARFLHIVDLDGAAEGRLVNFGSISEIIRNLTSSTKAEVGGGIRSLDDIKKYFDCGAERVVLSTKVLQDKAFLDQKGMKEIIKNIAVSIDIKGLRLEGQRQKGGPVKGVVVGTGTSAWSETIEIPEADFIRDLYDSGIRYINFSDISRDGTMAGPDINKIRTFLSAARGLGMGEIFFTYAGGISSLEDIEDLKSLGAQGVNAVIVGKALYEKKISLREALI